MKVPSNRVIIILLLLLSLKMQGQEIGKLLPSLSDLPGWTITSEPQVYADDNLFSLIDGGAELYLEYGFNKVVSVQYADPSLSNILVEIYEMTDAPAAYGIFSITQQTMEWSQQFGNLSTVNEDYISFWKNRYYVNISWSSRQHLDQPMLSGLADKIAQKIPEKTDYPDIVKDFKPLDQGKKAIFLKGNLALSNFYYFDYKDVFKIKEAVACSLVGYHRVIIKYPDQKTALEILADAKQSFSNNKRFTDVAMAFQGFSCKDNKGNFILIRQIENYIAILVAIDSNISLVPFMDEISQNIENSKK
jgi:hypothetical protein